MYRVGDLGRWRARSATTSTVDWWNVPSASRALTAVTIRARVSTERFWRPPVR